jgi:hypothetical protein
MSDHQELIDICNPLARQKGQARTVVSKEDRKRAQLEILGWLAEDPSITSRQLQLKVKELFPALGWTTIDHWTRAALQQYVERRGNQVYADLQDSITFWRKIATDEKQLTKDRIQAQKNLDVVTGAKWVHRKANDQRAATVSLNITFGQIAKVVSKLDRDRDRRDDAAGETGNASRATIDAEYKKLCEQGAESSADAIMRAENLLDQLDRKS